MAPLRMTERLRLSLAWLASLVYWVVGGGAFLVLCVLLPLIFSPHRAREAGQRALQAAFRGFVSLLGFFRVVECRYEGFEKLKAQTGGLIVAPNHPALWDAVFVLAQVDHAACVLKASLMCNPILFGGATAAGFIPNEPVHRMLRQCIDTLKQNGRLLFFPEGTRTRACHGTMNPLTGGLAIIAKNSGAPVWPVFVRTDNPYLSKGWPLWRLPRGRIHIQMTVGEPVFFPAEGEAQVFLDELRARYVEAGCGLAVTRPDRS